MWLATLGVAVAAVAGGIAIGLAPTQGTTPTFSATQSAQLTSVQAGCRQWLSASPTQPGTGRWCQQMTTWMKQQIERGGVGPEMMWGNPASMLSACQRWMTAGRSAGDGSTAQSWCASMGSWMSANVGAWSGRSSWGGWMRSGPMMGGLGP